MDIIMAYNEIKTDMRKNPTEEFKPIYKTMLDIASEVGITIPRTCARQMARSNVEASSPEESLHRTIFLIILFKPLMTDLAN